MATAWELCMKLGFIDGVVYTRGPSNMLLDKIEAWLQKCSVSCTSFKRSDLFNNFHLTTDMFLSRDAGSALWEKSLSNGYCNLVEWPKDQRK